MKKLGIFAVLFATMLILAACGGGNSDNGGNSASDNGSNNSGSASGSSIDLTATDWEFDKDTYTVQSGEEVTMSLTSKEGTHGAAIDIFDVDISGEGEATFTPEEPGEYEIYCSVPCGKGHDDMNSTLVVE